MQTKFLQYLFAFSGIGIAFYIISSVGGYMLRKQIRGKLELLRRIKNIRGVHKIKR